MVWKYVCPLGFKTRKKPKLIWVQDNSNCLFDSICVLIAVCCQPCTDSRVLTAVYWQPCTASRVLTAVYWQPCTDSRVLTAVYWQPCTDSRARKIPESTECQLHLTKKAHLHWMTYRHNQSAVECGCTFGVVFPILKGRQLCIHSSNSEWSFSKKRISVTRITAARMTQIERKCDLITKT